VVSVIIIFFTLFLIPAFIYALITDNIFAIVGLPLFWLLISGILLIPWYYESRGILQLSDHEIRFFYKLFSKSKDLNGFNRKGLVIHFNEIESIDIVTIPGDCCITATARQLIIRWKDGRMALAYLYHFGKKQEKEIIDILVARVRTNQKSLY
jgi:hypothetical protein